ncbi:MAG TPA: hypothetical protein VEY71_04595, partial [Chitinophagales bacterium]|nr:hypothetical protein [Chitinophagales bacterium]
MTVSSSSEIIRFTQSNLSGGGGQSSIDNCNGGPASYDIWYKFTATGTAHDILINFGQDNNMEFVEAFSGSCGSLTSIGCASYDHNYTVLSLTALTPGQTYYVRFYRGSAVLAISLNNWFRIAITTPLGNDGCGGAVSLDVISDENTEDNWRMFHTFGATESQEECATSPNNSSDDDVWFKFTATETKHSANVRSWAMMSYSVQLFSGSCGSLLNKGCKTSGSITVADLTPGETYYVRVYTNDDEVHGVFQIMVQPASPNDECDGAETIEVTAKADCSRGVYFDLKRASVSNVATVCGVSSYADVWYKFQPGTDAVFSKVNGDADADVILYSGSCASLTCLENFSANNDNLLAGLNASETYYLRVAGNVGNGRYICLSKDPGNDDCSDAIEVPVTPYGSLIDPVYGNVAGKTNSSPICNTGSTTPADVWYKFTATGANIVVSAFPTGYVEVMSGTCGSFTSLVCGGSGVPVFAKNLAVGTTYYVRVHSTSTQEKEFLLRVAEMAPNDECNTAIVLTPQSSSYVDEAITYGRIYASHSMPGCTIPYFADDDVWFKFTATDTAHAVMMKDAEIKNMVIEVLSGSCGPLTSMWCNYGVDKDYVSKTFFGLGPGQDYFIRVYSQFDSVKMEDHRFSLAVATPPSNDEMSGSLAITQFAPAGTSSRATFTSHGATKSHGQVCTGTTAQPNHDVWFYFIAQEAAHTVKVFSNNEFSTDPVFDYRVEAFNTFTTNYANLTSIDIGCATNTLNLTALPIGDTVYLRVFPFTSVSQTSDFSISVSSSQSIDEPSGALLLTPTNS